MRSHWRYIFFGLALTLGILFLFNNCGNISMDLGDFDSVNLGSTAGAGISAAEISAVLDRMPASEVENPRPLDDLVQDPQLSSVYKCADGVKVMICHFPEDVRLQGHACLSESVVQDHVDHIRTYDLGQGEKQIADYLGPCRVGL
jgi:hypothetical protein